jgi:F0F1-type ATP synthase epsilon subunit
MVDDRSPLTLDFIVRTPHEVVLDLAVRSARVLTETGHVGLRPRMEGTVLAIEAGLVNVKPAGEASDVELFVGTAGGLLIADGQRVLLLTPLAVAGDDEVRIADELHQAMQEPSSEMEARTALSKLEGHIVNELRRERKVQSGGTIRG